MSFAGSSWMYWVASLLGVTSGAAAKFLLLQLGFQVGPKSCLITVLVRMEWQAAESWYRTRSQRHESLSAGLGYMGSVSTVHMLERSPYAGLCAKVMAQCPVSSLFPQKETSSECDSLQAVVRMMCDARAPVVARW